MLTNLRQIKSFVCRQGRITKSQKQALHDLMPSYGIDYTNAVINLNATFSRDNPKIIEIGFGMGTSTAQIAKDNPNNDYLGIEVHSPGIGSLLQLLNTNQIHNVRIIQHDAFEVLSHMIADNTIDGFHIFFPDPWPKKRHNKRRIITPAFVNLLCNKLNAGGYIHLATDWEDYANWMLDILESNPSLVNESIHDGLIAKRPLTKFEQRGINLGHKIWDFCFLKAQ